MDRLGGTSLLAAALLTGCAATGVQRAPPPTPTAFSAGVQPADEAQLARWWTGFGDPQLTRLVDQALAGNPDMAAAQARIDQARAQARVAEAALLPSLNLSGSATATRLSENALPAGLSRLFGGGEEGEGGGGSGGVGLPGETFTTYQAGFDANWELDLFGGRHAAARAGQARAAAAEWNARDAAVRLSAEVARAYLDLVALRRRLALADESLAATQAILAASEAKARHGLADGRETGRRAAARDQAAASRAALAAEADIRLHYLATLTGQAPLALSDLATPADVVAPSVPVGLPADLLRRRPDLRAAERRLAAADAEAFAARADLYPKLTLSGTAGLASRALASLFDGDSLQATGAARAAFPLFDAGRRRAALAGRAEAAEADAAWRGQVLTALRETEDSLSRLEADRMRAERLAGAAQASFAAAEAFKTREANGLQGATESLDARIAWLQARDAEVQARAQAAADTVALVKALGGGWEAER